MRCTVSLLTFRCLASLRQDQCVDPSAGFRCVASIARWWALLYPASVESFGRVGPRRASIPLVLGKVILPLLIRRIRLLNVSAMKMLPSPSAVTPREPLRQLLVLAPSSPQKSAVSLPSVVSIMSFRAYLPDPVVECISDPEIPVSIDRSNWKVQTGTDRLPLRNNWV